MVAFFSCKLKFWDKNEKQFNSIREDSMEVVFTFGNIATSTNLPSTNTAEVPLGNGINIILKRIHSKFSHSKTCRRLISYVLIKSLNIKTSVKNNWLTQKPYRNVCSEVSCHTIGLTDGESL